MKRIQVFVCLLTVAGLLCGCSFQWNKWYVLDGQQAWREWFGGAGEDSERSEIAEKDDASEADGEGTDKQNSLWDNAQQYGFSEDMSFDEFTEYLFRDAVNTDTLNLHFYLTDPESYGITPGPVTLGSFEAADSEENQAAIDACREQLESYQTQEMDRDQQITMDLLNAYLDLCEKDMEFEYYYEPLGAGSGLHASMPYVMAEYAFYDRQDVEDYLELMTQMEDYFQGVLAWERERASRGLFMTDTALDMVLEECEAYLWDGKSEFFLKESFAERLDGLTELTAEEKQAYIKRNDEVLREEFADAYKSLIAGLKKLRGSAVNEQGLCYLEKGKEYYEYLIESNIGMTYADVNELYISLGEEVDGLGRQMNQILYSGGEALWNEWAQGYTDEREPEEILVRLEQCVKEDFPELGSNEYQIKKVEESMEELMNPAFYMIPPIDAFDQNAIYINEYKLGDGDCNLFAVLAHEGYPGHLYQNMYFNSMDYCNFRKILQFTGYSEGWATYVEYYSYRWMTEKSAAVNMLEMIYDQLNLALSAFMDIGIHYFGWSLEDTAGFCQQMLGFGKEDMDIVEEIYNYILCDPAGYLDYYVGYLEIRKMAEQAQEELGSLYDVKEFHRFILEFGPATFTVMQPYFEEWIEEQKEKIDITGTFRVECPGCSYDRSILLMFQRGAS